MTIKGFSAAIKQFGTVAPIPDSCFDSDMSWEDLCYMGSRNDVADGVESGERLLESRAGGTACGCPAGAAHFVTCAWYKGKRVPETYVLDINGKPVDP